MSSPSSERILLETSLFILLLLAGLTLTLTALQLTDWQFGGYLLKQSLGATLIGYGYTRLVQNRPSLRAKLVGAAGGLLLLAGLAWLSLLMDSWNALIRLPQNALESIAAYLGFIAGMLCGLHLRPFKHSS